MKKITIRIAESLCQQIIKDLSRKHSYAFERSGFLIGKSKEYYDNNLLIVITEYLQIPDEYYIEDDSVGARINSEAIRKAMQVAMDRKCSVFHVHKHFGEGTPRFSSTDLDELPEVIKAFENANMKSVHGAILLSDDGANVLFRPNSSIGRIHLEKIVRVGYPMSFNEQSYNKIRYDEDRYSRQSFLGEFSQQVLSIIKVGIIGLGGGGSHIVQQLAHLGILNYVLFDGDILEDSNLNRLIGANVGDARLKVRKSEVVYRQIIGLQPKAIVEIVNKKWQEQPESLQQCDVIFGAVDSFVVRRDIELESRRYLIPYIDIGMDVRILSPNPPRLFGQVILSVPGRPCMHCTNFLTDDLLARETEKYGDAGTKPQVVWSNGVLASNAVGIFVDLVTNWSSSSQVAFFQEYDGNNNSLTRSYKLDYLEEETCPHYPLDEAGPIDWGETKT
ncbi:MAG: ThiF family adenylyltransferase [Bacteroidales bacterium]|jgi:molybdopterin/thiamine biosynthesis adenylyltransferase